MAEDKIPHEKGITFNEVRDVLNKYGGRVVNTDLASAANSGNVRWEAKYKMVGYKNPLRQDLDETDTATYEPLWWKSDEGNCGVEKAVYHDIDSFLADVATTTPHDLWVYQPPTGGATSAFVLHDFAGYNPNAKFVQELNYAPVGDVRWSIDAEVLLLAFNIWLGQDDDIIDFTQIEYSEAGGGTIYLNSFYFGCIITKEGSDRKVLVAAKEPFNSTSGEAEHWGGFYSIINNMPPQIFNGAGTYVVYPVFFLDNIPDEKGYLASDYISSTGQSDNVDRTFIPAPIDAPLKINVVLFSASYEVTDLTATFDKANNRLQLSYKFHNKSLSVWEWSPQTNPMRMFITGYDWDNISTTTEVLFGETNAVGDDAYSIVQVSSHSVPANSTATITEDWIAISPKEGMNAMTISIRFDKAYALSATTIRF